MKRLIDRARLRWQLMFRRMRLLARLPADAEPVRVDQAAVDGTNAREWVSALRAASPSRDFDPLSVPLWIRAQFHRAGLMTLRHGRRVNA